MVLPKMSSQPFSMKEVGVAKDCRFLLVLLLAFSLSLVNLTLPPENDDLLTFDQVRTAQIIVSIFTTSCAYNTLYFTGRSLTSPQLLLVLLFSFR